MENNIMERKHFKILVLTTILFLTQSVWSFDPKPGTPLANKEHPRLHITQETIPELRQLISVHFRDEFQDYVNWAHSTSDGLDENIIYEAGHDPLRALMVHQAFIAALGQVPGISYPASLERFAERASNTLIARLNSGQKVSYVVPLVYDWTFNLIPQSKRQQIANLVVNRNLTHKVFDVSVANPDLAPEQMFSSKYYECHYPWYVALAFWGDGFIDAQADRAVDTFRDDMLNWGYVDAHNFVAGNTGGWSEWIGYSSWHPRTHFLNIDAWRTATGENYFTTKAEVDGNAVANYPSFMRYAIDPHKYFNRHYTYVRMGSAETTDPSFEHRSMREQIYVLPRMLEHSGLTQEAGLLHDMIDRYELKWSNYEHFYLWNFLGAYKIATKTTPEELNFKKSLWAKNLGIFYARTGFSDPADGVFAVMDGHYRFDGHRGADDFSGFALVKHGTLVNTRYVAHRGYGNLDNYVDGYRENTIYFDNGANDITRKTMDTPAELKAAYQGDHDYDHGGIEQVSVKDDHYFYVRVNRERMLANGYKHSRDFIWIPGDAPASDSDFLVIYDRVQSPSKPHWIYHVPWKPTVTGFSSTEDITTGSGTDDRIGDGYTGSDMILKELNSLGGESDGDKGKGDYIGGGVAHGVAFVKTLLPQTTRMEVSRVASFDGQVYKRQHHLAIKSHRWQVTIKPTTTQNSNKFLNVFQTADANNVSQMTNATLIQVGSSMHGAFIARENSSRPNYVALFNQNLGVNNNTVTYSINGTGTTRHIISGLAPFTTYEIEYGGQKIVKTTQPQNEYWDYRGAATNQKNAVLYFETDLNGQTTFKVSRSNNQDSTPPTKVMGIKANQ